MALAMIAAGFDFYVPVSAFFLESRGLSLTAAGDLYVPVLCSTRLLRFFLQLAQISPFMLFRL